MLNATIFRGIFSFYKQEPNIWGIIMLNWIVKKHCEATDLFFEIPNTLDVMTPMPLRGCRRPPLFMCKFNIKRRGLCSRAFRRNINLLLLLFLRQTSFILLLIKAARATGQWNASTPDLM